MSAVKYHSTRTAQGWATHLEVEFTGRDGQPHQVTGPIMGAHLVTSTKPRKVLHVDATERGIAVCEAAGLKFWAIAEGPRTYWATDGQSYFQVHHDVRAGLIDTTPVDAWGTASGETGAVVYAADFR